MHSRFRSVLSLARYCSPSRNCVIIPSQRLFYHTTPAVLHVSKDAIDPILQRAFIDNNIIVMTSEQSGEIDTERTKALHRGMLRALQTIYNPVKPEHVKSMGQSGLQALKQAVLQEIARKQRNKENVQITVNIDIPHLSTSFDLPWRENESILDLSTSTNMGEQLLAGEGHLEGVCGGNMSCCTCHVYLNNPVVYQAFMDGRRDDEIEAEQDMLDLAYEFEPEKSRLGCQVRLTKAVYEKIRNQNVTITIPAGVNNVWN